MPRFFIDDRPQGELYTLTGENAHHAGRVLRLRPGETLTLCDGAGTDFDCTVEQAEKDEVVCRVQAVHPSETEPRQDMTLFMALPKGDKMEFVIQKSVELGVRKIVPFLSKNCVSRPDKTDKKVERWRKIAVEAAKQCGRGYLPVVTAVESAEKAFAMASDSGTALFFYEHRQGDCARRSKDRVFRTRSRSSSARRAASHPKRCRRHRMQVFRAFRSARASCGVRPRLSQRWQQCCTQAEICKKRECTSLAKSNVGKKPMSEEEYTTNKVLTVFSVCLLGVLVLMILQRLLNYGSTFMIGLIVTRILLAIGIIGVVGGLVMLGMERTGRRNGSRRIICGRNLLIASVVMTVCMSAISYIGIAPIKALYVILPVLAVFYLVYHSYSTEFFVITVDCGAALGMMWLVHRALVSSNFTWMAYAVLIAAAVLTVAQIAVVNSVRGRQGKAKNTGKKAEARFSSNAFLMMTVTPILMTVLTAVVLFAPAHMLVVMGAAAAYLFVTAVYYTVKLM